MTQYNLKFSYFNWRIYTDIFCLEIIPLYRYANNLSLQYYNMIKELYLFINYYTHIVPGIYTT